MSAPQRGNVLVWVSASSLCLAHSAQYKLRDKNETHTLHILFQNYKWKGKEGRKEGGKMLRARADRDLGLQEPQTLGKTVNSDENLGNYTTNKE